MVFDAEGTSRNCSLEVDRQDSSTVSNTVCTEGATGEAIVGEWKGTASLEVGQQSSNTICQLGRREEERGRGEARTSLRNLTTPTDKGEEQSSKKF